MMDIQLNREYDEYCSRCLKVVRAFIWYVFMTIDANDDNNDDDDENIMNILLKVFNSGSRLQLICILKLATAKPDYIFW